jgi:magnesium transporter
MMVAPVHDDLAEELPTALRVRPGNGGMELNAVLLDRHPADIAAALRELSLPEALIVFGRLDNPCAAEVLDELDPQMTQYLVDHVPARRMTDLLDQLPMDDAAEVVAEADPTVSAQLLADLSAQAPDDAAEARTLLAYPEDSAGRSPGWSSPTSAVCSKR